ncbi:MAG: hypothetical protein ACYDBR_00465 [Gaiellaceae bacterium]
MRKLAAAAALAALVLLSLAAAAGAKTDGGGRIVKRIAAPPINYGVADDGGKYADLPQTFFSALKGAGLTEDRWTLNMDQNNPTAITELPFLQRAAPIAQADGVHVVLALYATTVKDGSGNVLHPSAQSDPTAFCTWAALVAKTVSVWGIHDFIVWNEPNTALYWAPQDANAPAAYEALLAKCYDTIHAADASARVIGFGLSPRSNGPSQTAPIDFIKGVGAAYKASGRTTPIMDQMSIHPYPNPNSPTDSPDVGYANPSSYGIPNLDRVKQALYDAFNGTAQPTTLNGLTFRIDELGWQTDTTAYTTPYYHTENVAVVTEQQQADYVAETVQKYFACDPTVTDVEFFLLQDEASRDGKDLTGATIGGGWQSGFMTPDGKPKIAYTQDAPLFAQGRAACTGQQIDWQPAGSTTSGGGGTTTGGGAKHPVKKHPVKKHPVKKHPVKCTKFKTVKHGKKTIKVCIKH